MVTASTNPRARDEPRPEGPHGGHRPALRGVRWSLLAWAAVMAVALLSSAVHLMHDGWVGLYRVGATPGLQVQRARPAAVPAPPLAQQHRT